MFHLTREHPQDPPEGARELGLVQKLVEQKLDAAPQRFVEFFCLLIGFFLLYCDRLI